MPKGTIVKIEAFVDAVVELGDADAVATKLGMKVETVRARAAGLRKKGVSLPKFPRQAGGGAKPLDIEALNARIEAAAAVEE